MRTLKITEEIRVDSETEAKELMEKYRQEAHEKGYTLGASGYTYKTKKSKGQIVDDGFLVKAVKIYTEFWGEY